MATYETGIGLFSFWTFFNTNIDSSLHNYFYYLNAIFKYSVIMFYYLAYQHVHRHKTGDKKLIIKVYGIKSLVQINWYFTLQ